MVGIPEPFDASLTVVRYHKCAIRSLLANIREYFIKLRSAHHSRWRFRILDIIMLIFSPELKSSMAGEFRRNLYSPHPLKKVAKSKVPILIANDMLYPPQGWEQTVSGRVQPAWLLRSVWVVDIKLSLVCFNETVALVERV